jgi:predicted acetyltransferase
MAGVAAVGVPPEHRARKVAFELLQRMLREVRERGYPLSALYASTQRLYRKLGYEQAGNRVLYALPARSVPRERREIEATAVDPSRHELLHDLYRRAASRNAGNLDRNEGIWKRVVIAPADELMFAYLLGSPPEGYIVYTQKRVELAYDLQVRDLVALTPRAVRAAWAFLGDHGSMANEIKWVGPAVDPFPALLPEQHVRPSYASRWMLRVTDVAKALEARGYEEGLAEELHLEVTDDVLPENEGRWILRVKDGRAKAERGGRGEMRLHVRGLAPLYSGFLPPNALATLGWIEAPEAALRSAGRLFGGPEPWMQDMF